MPRTSSVLSQESWCDFGRWLEAQRQKLDDKDKRKPKNAMAKALGRKGELSTNEINVYLKGQKLPREAGVRLLARHLGISEELALLHAGYLAPLLRDLPPLLATAREYCRQDGIAFEQCIVSNGIMQTVDGDRYMNSSLPEARPKGHFVAPWPAMTAIHIAVSGFPLRGERRRFNVWSCLGRDDTAEFNLLEKTKKRKLPHELSIAITLLKERALNTQQRRAAAGEFVRAWILRECGDLAEAVISGIYEPPTPCVCPLQFVDEEPEPIPCEEMP